MYLEAQEEVLGPVLRALEPEPVHLVGQVERQALLDPLRARGHVRRTPYQLFQLLRLKKYGKVE